jgi:hypothetical protein
VTEARPEQKNGKTNSSINGKNSAQTCCPREKEGYWQETTESMAGTIEKAEKKEKNQTKTYRPLILLSNRSRYLCLKDMEQLPSEITHGGMVRIPHLPMIFLNCRCDTFNI